MTRGFASHCEAVRARASESAETRAGLAARGTDHCGLLDERDFRRTNEEIRRAGTRRRAVLQPRLRRGVQHPATSKASNKNGRTPHSHVRAIRESRNAVRERCRSRTRTNPERFRSCKETTQGSPRCAADHTLCSNFVTGASRKKSARVGTSPRAHQTSSTASLFFFDSGPTGDRR